ncbi:para-nitrobenzyl esterase [Leucobacter komagatae]|uniref:Carboxylic ester hydrolase n=1 Tax=Leucobacter komagatae TaxID=55969 RepID=A0A542Y9Z9_9MICO|nr:carboxylesterase family protein [Leucobacter komagatae]TQL40889.1 para-nitrobenzyl esterase [Leucobacter komagatae]TQL44911.1 para-nitrobenzyl esterase [Leucobacter komagatae]
MGDAEAQRSANTTTVTTTLGEVVGSESNGIRRFLGIPYAKAPFGELRFRAPEQPEAWNEPLQAKAFGPTAPQTPYQGSLGELIKVPAIEGTEILTVNVWAPADAAGAPVVLWLHGGALERGAAAQSGYDGRTFARDGIVFVSANYRLGAEGFSVLDGAPLNLGLRDAQAALDWAHREVAAFGGDPGRITIMGESAGGALVAALLSQPQARAKAARAIIQSGPLEAVDAVKARRASDAIAKQLGISTSREAFAAAEPADLLRARSEIAAGSSPLSGTPGYALALDPESLPASPVDALAGIDTPILIGTNTDEYRLWFTPEALAGISGAKAWIARLAMRVPGRAARAVRKAFPSATPGEQLGQIVTDKLLRAPATRVARARTAPTFVYEFAWESPVRDLRAAHALDLAFAFDLLEDEDAVRLNGEGAPAGLGREMHAAWVAFIRDGDPGWPAFGEGRATRVFNERSETVAQRRAAIVDALG